MTLKLSKKDNNFLNLGKVKFYMQAMEKSEDEINKFLQKAVGEDSPGIIEIARQYIDDIVSD
jgi:hypothetical protein